MGYAEKTFMTKRDELIKVGLLKIEKINRNKTQKITFCKPKRAPELNVPLGEEEEYFKTLQKQLSRPITEAEIEAQNQLKIDAMVSEKAKEKANELVKKKEEVKKREEQRFPAEDYRSVIDAYKKYKGLGLKGPEENRAKHTIKQMFLAERSVKDIVDCIKFFTEYQGKESFEWMRSWGMETIMKKMPEFIAGKLKPHRMEDDYPDL